MQKVERKRERLTSHWTLVKVIPIEMSANTPEMTAKDGSNLLDKLKKLSVEEKVEKHQVRQALLKVLKVNTN